MLFRAHTAHETEPAALDMVEAYAPGPMALERSDVAFAYQTAQQCLVGNFVVERHLRAQLR